jgi:transcriptional regulator with XRE-family HTH domain
VARNSSLFAFVRGGGSVKDNFMSVPTEGFPADSGGVEPKNRGSIPHSNGAAKAVTMASVARVSGISQGAISSLLNDRDYGIRVSPKTREKVFKICRDLGYVPNDLRAVVRIYPELGETCLLVSDKISGGLANPFVARLAASRGSPPAWASSSTTRHRSMVPPPTFLLR